MHSNRIKRQGLSLLAALLLAFSLLVVPALAAASVPEPTEDFYAADFAGVLTIDTKDDIVSRNRTLNQQTGAEIVVVTVEFLDGMDIEQYAYTLYNQWGIGSADKDNGVLLLLAIGEDDYWCVQGAGLEKQLGSDTIGDILHTYLEPDFAAGEYDAGVQKTFDVLYEEVEDIYHTTGGTTVGGGNTVAPGNTYTPSHSTTRSFSLIGIMGGLIFLFVIAALLTSWSRAFGRRRTVIYRNTPRYWGGRPYGPPPPPRGPMPPPPPRSNNSPPPSSFGGWSNGGGGSTRGGGAGRSSGGGFFSGGSSSSRSSSSRSSSSRSSGGGSRSGGSSRSGGGSTRGGGAGRGR